MKKLIIVVGTISEPKIKYLKDVLRELRMIATIIPIKVNSQVSEQPKTSVETKRGSINRAKKAFQEKRNVDFAVGIEVGYHKNYKRKYEMFCWVTIIGEDGFQLSNQSHKFLLPQFHQNLLHKDLYIGDNLDGYHKNKKDLIKKHIDDIIRHRKPFIENALKHSLIHYFNREDF